MVVLQLELDKTQCAMIMAGIDPLLAIDNVTLPPRVQTSVSWKPGTTSDLSAWFHRRRLYRCLEALRLLT